MFNLNFITMKRNYFLSAIAVFGLMTLASCSNDDDPVIDNGGNQEAAAGEQVIVLDMQDTDVLSTKSRPLYSTTNQGAELVTDVKLLVFKIGNDNQKTFVKSIDVSDWDQTSTDYTYGRQRTIRLTGEDKLEATDGDSYTIVAVGQDEASQTPVPFKFGGSANPTALPDLSISATPALTWNSAAEAGQGFSNLFTNAITYTDLFTEVAASSQIISEIFSGQSEPFEIKYDGGFQASVLLKRQVAGVLGYFERIPAKAGETPADVRFIRLVSSARNDQLDLTTQLGVQEDDATESTGATTENVVNGFNGDNATTGNTADAWFGTGTAPATKNAYTVYQIDLTKWFPGAVQSGESPSGWAETGVFLDQTTLLGKPETWVNALSAANRQPTVKAGAVLAGEFVIPFDKNLNNTFELQLLGWDGTTVLKSWNVKLDASSIAGQDNADVYSIYRNHLYQIGKRGAGDDPNNPGTDPDKPQPLDKDQDLTIRINDQWEFIHDMGIE